MCPVLLPLSMVPLDDNLAGETAIFNQTLIYCACTLAGVTLVKGMSRVLCSFLSLVLLRSVANINSV